MQRVFKDTKRTLKHSRQFDSIRALGGTCTLRHYDTQTFGHHSTLKAHKHLRHLGEPVPRHFDVRELRHLNTWELSTLRHLGTYYSWKHSSHLIYAHFPLNIHGFFSLVTDLCVLKCYIHATFTFMLQLHSCFYL